MDIELQNNAGENQPEVVANPLAEVDHLSKDSESGIVPDRSPTLEDLYSERKMTSCLDGVTMYHFDISTCIIIVIVESLKFIVYVAVLVNCATACVLPDHTAAITASPILSLYLGFDIANKIYRGALWLFGPHFESTVEQTVLLVLILCNQAMMIVAVIAYSRTLTGVVNFAINATVLIAIGNIDIAMFPHIERLRMLPREDVYVKMTNEKGYWKYQAALMVLACGIILICMLVFNLLFWPQVCQPTCPCYSQDVCDYFKENNCVTTFRHLDEMCSWNTTVLSCYMGKY